MRTRYKNKNFWTFSATQKKNHSTLKARSVFTWMGMNELGVIQTYMWTHCAYRKGVHPFLCRIFFFVQIKHMLTSVSSYHNPITALYWITVFMSKDLWIAETQSVHAVWRQYNDSLTSASLSLNHTGAGGILTWMQLRWENTLEGLWCLEALSNVVAGVGVALLRQWCGVTASPGPGLSSAHSLGLLYPKPSTRLQCCVPGAYPLVAPPKRHHIDMWLVKGNTWVWGPSLSYATSVTDG